MIPQIAPHELKAKLDAGESMVLIDCRQPEEYAVCRLPNSTLIPLGELAGRAGEIEVPAGGQVVVYCHHGMRSLTGTAVLLRAGLTNVASLSGGIDAWSARVDPSVPRY